MCCDIVTVSVDVVTFEFVLLLYHIINSILFTAVEADLYECFKSEENWLQLCTNLDVICCDTLKCGYMLCIGF